MANSWIEALKKWNNTTNKGKAYCIPKKGSKEYDEVRKLMKSPKKKDVEGGE